MLVVNTCAFIDSAKQESIDAILEMAELKKSGTCQRLVVTGCLAERYRDDLRAQIGEIDAVLGTGEVPAIVGAITGRPRRRPVGRAAARCSGSPRPKPAPRPEPRRCPSTSTTPTRRAPWSRPQHFAYVKIAEGCDYTCAFCIIPTLRGHYRSRTSESIVAEARRLAARGVKELLLISQDTTFYGIDRGERGALGRLLRELDRVPGLEWIRLLYLYPTTITDDVLDAMAECEKVCRYVDLPLQHASAAVLKRMKRPGTGTTYRRLLDRIRTRVPGVTLRTTFIVGFPGETDEDFADLESFVKDVEFDHVGVFTYSHEEGTSAYARADDVPARTKTRRRNALMAAQKRIVQRTQRRRRGERVRVLVDGPAPDHGLVLRGRLEGQAPDIDSCVYLTDADPELCHAGDMVDGVVEGGRGYDLIVRPLPGV